MKKVLIASSLLMASVNAYSQTSIFGKPSFYGNGCKQGTTQVHSTEKTILVTFNDYSVMVGGFGGEIVGKSDCTIDIPMNVPRGYSATVTRVEYYGFAQIPEGGQLAFSADYFFDSRKGLSTRDRIRGPFEDGFQIFEDVNADTRIVTDCGSKPILRIRSNMILNSNANLDEAFANLDRTSAGGKIQYHYNLTPCNIN